MTQRNVVVFALACIATLSACASRPQAPPPLPPVPPAPAPAPEATTTLSAPPIVTAASIAPGSQADFLNAAQERVFFDLDQHVLTPNARAVLEAQAEWLRRYGEVRVLIEGNADERGTREYNLALGARRASAVRDFLIARGVGASRITTVSYGKDRPIDLRSNEAGWAINRNARTALVNAPTS